MSSEKYKSSEKQRLFAERYGLSGKVEFPLLKIDTEKAREALKGFEEAVTGISSRLPKVLSWPDDFPTVHVGIDPARPDAVDAFAISMRSIKGASAAEGSLFITRVPDGKYYYIFQLLNVVDGFANEVPGTMARFWENPDGTMSYESVEIEEGLEFNMRELQKVNKATLSLNQRVCVQLYERMKVV